MMKATRSSPESQRSAFSDNSSVTECSRCEHFSPCSCCCRLVTERLDAGPSHHQSNVQPICQSQRAASTTSPNPNVQPSEPTPATSNAADVSTSLRALAAVSTCDQPMEIAHPNTSTIPVTAATSRPISDPFGSEPPTNTPLQLRSPLLRVPNNVCNSTTPVHGSAPTIPSVLNQCAQPSNQSSLNQHTQQHPTILRIAVGKRSFLLPPVEFTLKSPVLPLEPNTQPNAKSQSEIKSNAAHPNPADRFKLTVTHPPIITHQTNQSHQIKSQELSTQFNNQNDSFITSSQSVNHHNRLSTNTNQIDKQPNKQTGRKYPNKSQELTHHMSGDT